MSVTNIINNTSDKIPGRNKGPSWFGQLKTSMTHIAGFGLSTGFAYYQYAPSYGVGFSMAYGLAASIPYMGVAIGLAEVGVGIGNASYEFQKQKRVTSLSAPNMNDQYGNMNKMRQHSIQQLARTRASGSRYVGNEATYYHNR